MPLASRDVSRRTLFTLFRNERHHKNPGNAAPGFFFVSVQWLYRLSSKINSALAKLFCETDLSARQASTHLGNGRQPDLFHAFDIVRIAWVRHISSDNLSLALFTDELPADVQATRF